MRPRRAFILEPTDYDTTAASRHGSIVRLFRSYTEHMPATHAEFAEDVTMKLRAYLFDPEVDYLVVTGRLHSMVGMVAAAIGEYGPVNVLLFDNDEKDYVTVKMGERQDARSREETVR